MRDSLSGARRVPEYGHIDVEISERQARLIQAAAGSRLSVTPTAGGYRIGATSYVGTISVPGFVLHVDPKVPVRNLLYLLTWSTHRLQFEDVEIDRATGDLTAAMAVIYSRMLERTLALGTDRAYIEEEDRLVTLRGRIDWPAQSRQLGLPTPLACKFDEWSVDTTPNRLVKAAARALLQLPSVPFPTAHALRRLVVALEGVTFLGPGDLATELNLTRLNNHYDEVTRLARLVLTSVGIAHGPGPAPSTAFLINMNDVFEDFVHYSLAHALQGSLRVVRHRGVPLGTRGHVRGEPDLIFTDLQGNDVLVADTKYKLTRDGRGRSSDYYQLHAYCTSLALPRGVLIYCDADGELPARRVEVRHQGDILETYRLSVSGDPEGIAMEVRRLRDFLIPPPTGFAASQV